MSSCHVGKGSLSCAALRFAAMMLFLATAQLSTIATAQSQPLPTPATNITRTPTSNATVPTTAAPPLTTTNATSAAASWPGTSAATAAAPTATPEIDISSIPEACVTGGTDLQTYCLETITMAQAYFNVSSDPNAPPLNITDDQVQSYINTMQQPTPDCCRVACEFNSNFCNCNQGILVYANQFVGNNPMLYRSIAKGFQRVCNYSLIIDQSCPTPELQATLPKQACIPPATPAVTVADTGPTAAPIPSSLVGRKFMKKRR